MNDYEARLESLKLAIREFGMTDIHSVLRSAADFSVFVIEGRVVDGVAPVTQSLDNGGSTTEAPAT